jgi:hypothetical protein
MTIDNRMEAIRSAVSLSEQEVTQFAQLQETKESIRQYMRVVADAGEALGDERCNIFEDITMTDSSYGISVSTVKDLVVARRINLSGQARYLGGQISDESYEDNRRSDTTGHRKCQDQWTRRWARALCSRVSQQRRSSAGI